MIALMDFSKKFARTLFETFFSRNISYEKETFGVKL